MEQRHGQSGRVVQGERHAAVRLLKALMMASVVLPLVLFVITAWVDYRNFERLTNERIARSTSCMNIRSGLWKRLSVFTRKSTRSCAACRITTFA